MIHEDTQCMHELFKPMIILYFYSELSVFANNSTKAGVIVETMSAPNPVSHSYLYQEF